jgi:recombination associated protein RdgC
LPEGFILGNDAELKAPDEDGAKVKFSNHVLSADDVQSHLQDKLVTKIALHQPEGLSLHVSDDSSIKGIKYHELLTGQNEEMGWEDLSLRLDADLLLMSSSLNKALKAISQQLQATNNH